MNGKYDIEKLKSWLSEYKENEKDVEVQLERLARMQARMESCSAPELTDMPKSAGFTVDKLSMQMAKKIDLENSIKEFLKNQQLYLERIEYLVELLPKAKERAIIRMRYEDGAPWATVVDRVYGKYPDFQDREQSYYRMMYRIHKGALKKMAAYLQDSNDSYVEFYRDFVPRVRYYS